MTEAEYKETSERLEKYKNAQGKISSIESKKDKISLGILSLKCKRDIWVDFDYLGEDFKERLVNNIISFLDLEIETIKKSIEDI